MTCWKIFRPGKWSASPLRQFLGCMRIDRVGVHRGEKSILTAHARNPLFERRQMRRANPGIMGKVGIGEY
jgi:hypothetical protein